MPGAADAAGAAGAAGAGAGPGAGAVVPPGPSEMGPFAVGVGAQVPGAPHGPVAADDVETLAAITIFGALGGLDGPLGGQPAQADTFRPSRPTTALAGVLVIDIDVAVGASRLVEVVPVGDDGAVGPPRHDVHGPGPPVAGHARGSETRSDRVSARLVLEADVFSAVGAAGPALTELDLVSAARVNETCGCFHRGALVIFVKMIVVYRNETQTRAFSFRARTERGSRGD